LFAGLCAWFGGAAGAEAGLGVAAGDETGADGFGAGTVEVGDLFSNSGPRPAE